MKHIKCVLVGDEITGKCEILISYTTNAFPGEYIPTVFDNYSANIMVEDQAINLQLWNTAGQEDYKKLRPLTYPQTDIFICVFSLVNPVSLANVENLWVPEIKEHCPDTPYILAGNKLSFRDEFPQHADEFKANGWEPVTREQGEQMMKKVGALDYVECDSLKQINLKELFETAVKYVLHPPQKNQIDKSKKKKSIFHLFKTQKNKDKKSSKNDKNQDSDVDFDNPQVEIKQDKSTLKISSSTFNEANNNQDRKSLKISAPTTHATEKEMRKQLKISLLNSQDFLNDQQKQDNNNMFIGEDEEKYHIFIEKIGQTEFAILNKIFDTTTNQVMCKKILIPEDQLFSHMKNAIKEFELLQLIDNPCVCKLFGMNTTETILNKDEEEITTIALFLEYLEYDLKNLILKGILTNSIKVRIIIEIVHAMIYIHNHKMIYRDLKIENIRLNSNFNSKIVDVGLVKINESLYSSSCSQTSFNKNLESAIFMSPEILKEDDEYDYKTDVYSFGMVLLFITDGKLPKYSIKDKLQMKDVPLPKPSSSISEYCIDLISRCISFDPQSRPSFDDILNEIRSKSYNLCSNVDKTFVSLRDQELNKFDS